MAIGLPGLAAAIAAFIFLVMAAVALGRGSGVRGRLLAAFLALLAGPLINLLVLSSDLVTAEPRLAFIGNTLGLAAAPVLYLFARALSEKDFQPGLGKAVHFIPLFAIAIIVASNFHLQPRAAQLAILTDPTAASLLNEPALVLAIFVYPIAYLIAAFRVAHRHERRARAVQARSDGRELRWLSASLIGLAAGAAVSLVQYVAADLLGWMFVSNALIVLLAIGALGLATYFLVHAFPSLSGVTGLPPADDESKYGEARIEVAELEAFDASLSALLRENEPYRDPDLTLDGLARQLPMTRRELSQTINRVHGCSFYEFIARCRIEAAKDALRNDPDLPVTDVMHAVGFASKSSFYDAFKAATGSTPGEWRRVNDGFENAQTDDD